MHVVKLTYNDLTGGNNCYTIQLMDFNGNIKNTVEGCLIKCEEELDRYIKEKFRINDYYLVVNEESSVFNKPKVKEIKYTAYKYKIAK